MQLPDSSIDPIAAAIDDYHHQRGITEPPRPHLGASLLGHHCERWLWLSFRWAVQPRFDGRVVRLFRRGQREEDTVVADLRAIGCHVTHTGAHQSRVDCGCHVGGSKDGIIEHGLPGAPATRHVLEIKTHNRKSFDQLEKDGVEKSKPQHYTQMQVYMFSSKIERALYVAVCKDDDRIYTERVRLDAETAEKAIKRGHRIALSERIPPPISQDPSWWRCKWCDAHDFCHGTKLTQHANCRTCAHSTPMPDSTWRCERHQADGIPVEFQRTGCDCHVLHPDVVPWSLDVELSTDIDAAWRVELDGQTHIVRNGEPDGRIYSSRELLADLRAVIALGDDGGVTTIREQMGGRFVRD